MAKTPDASGGCVAYPPLDTRNVSAEALHQRRGRDGLPPEIEVRDPGAFVDLM